MGASGGGGMGPDGGGGGSGFGASNSARWLGTQLLWRLSSLVAGLRAFASQDLQTLPQTLPPHQQQHQHQHQHQQLLQEMVSTGDRRVRLALSLAAMAEGAPSRGKGCSSVLQNAVRGLRCEQTQSQVAPVVAIAMVEEEEEEEEEVLLLVLLQALERAIEGLARQRATAGYSAARAGLSLSYGGARATGLGDVNDHAADGQGSSEGAACSSGPGWSAAKGCTVLDGLCARLRNQSPPLGTAASASRKVDDSHGIKDIGCAEAGESNRAPKDNSDESFAALEALLAVLVLLAGAGWSCVEVVGSPVPVMHCSFCARRVPLARLCSPVRSNAAPNAPASASAPASSEPFDPITAHRSNCPWTMPQSGMPDWFHRSWLVAEVPVESPSSSSSAEVTAAAGATTAAATASAYAPLGWQVGLSAAVMHTDLFCINALDLPSVMATSSTSSTVGNTEGVVRRVGPAPTPAEVFKRVRAMLS